jgi:uncharacterized protein
MSQPVIPPKPNALTEIFGVPKPVIGVVHLGALPGAPRYEGEAVEEVYRRGVQDAVAMAEGGIDGIIVENASDLPFSRPEDIGPETVAALACACLRVRDAVSVPLGITCVANGAVAALAVAKAVGASWVRVNQFVNAYVANEGLLSGAAGAALRYRAALRAKEVRIFADVHVKFGAHALTADRTIPEQARDAEFFDADVVIASGQRTGAPTPVEEIRAVQEGTVLPVLIGSGFTVDAVDDLLAVADGAIIGSWLKRDGVWWNAVDPARVAALMDRVRALRRRLAP